MQKNSFSRRSALSQTAFVSSPIKHQFLNESATKSILETPLNRMTQSRVNKSNIDDELNNDSIPPLISLSQKVERSKIRQSIYNRRLNSNFTTQQSKLFKLNSNQILDFKNYSKQITNVNRIGALIWNILFTIGLSIIINSFRYYQLFPSLGNAFCIVILLISQSILIWLETERLHLDPLKSLTLDQIRLKIETIIRSKFTKEPNPINKYRAIFMVVNILLNLLSLFMIAQLCNAHLDGPNNDSTVFLASFSCLSTIWFSALTCLIGPKFTIKITRSTKIDYIQRSCFKMVEISIIRSVLIAIGSSFVYLLIRPYLTTINLNYTYFTRLTQLLFDLFKLFSLSFILQIFYEQRMSLIDWFCIQIDPETVLTKSLINRKAIIDYTIVVLNSQVDLCGVSENHILILMNHLLLNKHHRNILKMQKNVLNALFLDFDALNGIVSGCLNEIESLNNLLSQELNQQYLLNENQTSHSTTVASKQLNSTLSAVSRKILSYEVNLSNIPFSIESRKHKLFFITSVSILVSIIIHSLKFDQHGYVQQYFLPNLINNLLDLYNRLTSYCKRINDQSIQNMKQSVSSDIRRMLENGWNEYIDQISITTQNRLIIRLIQEEEKES